jgi:hypothetical protein
VLFPGIASGQILWILGIGTVAGVAAFGATALLRRPPAEAPERLSPLTLRLLRVTWRMPALAALAPARLTPAKKLWMIVLRLYLVVAVGMVVVRVVQLALNGG